MVDSGELASAVLEPHFDAVRDTFVEYCPDSTTSLEKLRDTKMVVVPEVHDSDRHFARCRTDGLLIQLAPQVVRLPYEYLVAILVHEFGHAADFAYPGNWVTPENADGEAVWIGDRNDKPARKWRRLWHDRNADQIEWAADAIAFAVTGARVTYCGDCMLQCFSGKRRPRGLR